MGQDTSKSNQEWDAIAWSARKPIETNKVCDWIEHLKTKHPSFTSEINNGFLFEAMKALLIVKAISEPDLVEIADIAIHENTSFSKGVMDIEEAVRVSVRAVVQNIEENMSHG
jgi:hypothetical protein